MAISMSEPPDIPHKHRKRTKKACDRCNISRVRCDGSCPCQRCNNSGYSCEYTRSTKQRGRKPGSRAERSTSIHSPTNQPEAGESLITPNGVSDSRVLDLHSVESSSLLPHSYSPHALSPGNNVDSLSSEHTTRPRVADERIYGQQSILNDSDHSDNRRPLHGFTSSPWNEPIAHPVPVPNDRIRSEAASSTLHYTSLPQHHGSGVRFKCLENIMPRLIDIIQPEVADQLLAYYFQTPGTTPMSNASPYVLTQVIREKSLLRSHDPRPTSSALLVTMLWVSAQTAESIVFFAPGQRRWICDRLRNLALVLISARDQCPHQQSGFRAESSGSYRDLTVDAPTSSDEAMYQDHMYRVQHNFDESRRYSVDDVLVFILFSVVISSGDYKADCYVWWMRAVRAARLIRLNEEENSESVTDLDQSNDQERFVQYHSFQDAEKREERRRTFWLLFCVDRHLAISFNTPLTVLETECQVVRPLPDHVWENMERYSLEQLRTQMRIDPPTTVTGTGFFEFFLPLMTILGNIICVRQILEHPRFGVVDGQSMIKLIEADLSNCARSIDNFACRNQTSPCEPLGSPQRHGSHGQASLPETAYRNLHRTKLVSMYSTFMLHVLYVLLHGKWDAISMLDNENDWIGSPGYLHCTSHAILASEAISQILEYDPELMFMPYLLGIYLLHESFILLLFADRMAHLGPNESVKKACETIIRAHEVCMATLSTEFQRRFRKVLRSTMGSVMQAQWPDGDGPKSKRTVLNLYRWNAGGRGLGL